MTDAAPYASATLDFARPPEVVRAQFFDVDHAIRARLYHGVTLRWLPPEASGERRIRQEIKVMSRFQHDDFVLEEGATGTWVKRFVEGPNAGTRFVATFDAGSEGGTRVRLQAIVPKAGFIQGIGKLSQLGMEKALQKFLEEHRRGLEGYEPGRARGRMREALDACRDLAAPMSGISEADRRAANSNLLEAAHVVAVADGEADAAERDALMAVARGICFVDLDEAGCERMVRGVLAAVKDQGIEARCDKIGGRLRAQGIGPLGVAVAALVAEVSHGIDPPELAAVARLGTAAGLDEAAIAALIQRVGAALAGPE